jgi:Intracellular proteinase inhibitor
MKGLSFSLTTDKRAYASTAPAPTMKVTLEITNDSDPPLVLSFVTLQHYDVAIFNKQGDQVYLWSAGREFAVLQNTITVNHSQKWVVEVPLADATGTPFPAGDYAIRAYLRVDSEGSEALAGRYAGALGFSMK